MISDGIDIKDINPIVNVGTAKNPMHVLDATWMAVPVSYTHLTLPTILLV